MTGSQIEFVLLLFTIKVVWATPVARATFCVMNEPKRTRLSHAEILDELTRDWLSDEEDIVENDSDDGESDHVEEENILSDTESLGDAEINLHQPGQDAMTDDESDDNEPLGNIYFAKDKLKNVMKWKRNLPNRSQVRTRSRNIVLHLPGPKGEARNTNTEIECFNLFFDNNVIGLIVACTNVYIHFIQDRYQRERDARLTDATEIRAFLGILLLSGSLGGSRKKTKNIWDNSRGTGVEICYLAMSEKRFRFIMRCIRFDDIMDRHHRREIDRLAPIRELFELMIHSFQRFFTPSEYCTIDEQLVKFRGRCPFRMYIPSKPAKYGLKVFALVCAKTMYCLNLEVYVGSQPDGPYKLPQSAEEVTVRMIEPIAGTNRNLTSDNWFTSVSLAERLLNEKQLTMVGTIRCNRVGVPSEMRPHKERAVHSSLFAHHKEKTLVSYCTKPKKAVVLLSTMHEDHKIDENSGDLQKPEIITFYNQTKIGVDVLDQMCAKYDVARNTKRWPMVIFFDILNIATINASRIYNANKAGEPPLSRSDFITNIAWDLIIPKVRERVNVPMLPVELKRRARKLLGMDEPRPEPQPIDNKVGRCYRCGRGRDRSTRKCCSQCGHKICPDHTLLVCDTCMETTHQ